MSRWGDISGGDTGSGYDARFADLAASGADVHGEARFCAGLVSTGARILDAGCGTGRVVIWLAAQGYECVGVDSDPSMLGQARQAAPDIPWIEADLAVFDLAESGIAKEFDLVLTAGNVIPLVDEGTEAAVVTRLADHVRDSGLLVSGFGLDAAHLPLPEPTVTLADYDAWCAEAGLTLEGRYATWDGGTYDGGGYAVSIHRKTAGEDA